MEVKIKYDKYLKEVKGMYPMPRIMAEISKCLKNPDSELDSLATLIATDATLVSSVVKLSNSSYFGFTEKSDSLNEAIQRVGLREIVRIVGVYASEQVYQEELTHYRIPSEVFWESSVAAALLMERLAETVGLDPQEAYLAGLMREIGMLVIDFAMEAEGINESWDNYLPLLNWEELTCGANHVEAGTALLREWGFEISICEAVKLQWADISEGNQFSMLLKLVNRVLARTGCDFSVKVEVFMGLESLLETLGVNELELDAAIAASKETFTRLKAGVLESA